MKRKDQQYRKENEKGYKSKEGDITLTQEEEYKQYQKKLREEKKREKQLDEQAKLLELELEALLNEEVEESVKEVENVKEEIIIEEKKEVKYKRYSQFALPGMIKVEKGWVYPDEIVTERNKTFIMNKVDEIPLKKEPEPEVKQELKEEERKKEEEITEEIKVEPVKIKVKENIGLKLLRKQGWKEGTGLGKNNTGIIEPITSQEKKTLSSAPVNEREEYEILLENGKIEVDYESYRLKQMEKYKQRYTSHQE